MNIEKQGQQRIKHCMAEHTRKTICTYDLLGQSTNLDRTKTNQHQRLFSARKYRMIVILDFSQTRQVITHALYYQERATKMRLVTTHLTDGHVERNNK